MSPADPLKKRICSHHVDGRAGDRPFPLLARFERDLVNVLYDADKDCVAQIENRNKILDSQSHVLPYCIGDRNVDEVTFNINYDPYSSSLMDMNEKYADWYFYFRKDRYDYIIRDTLKTMERRKHSMVTLDEVSRRHAEIQPPDILSLDAQGVEYDIIQGSPKTMRSSVLAVLTEVEFHPMYKGQKLFGDVSALLREKGFHFVKFTKPAAEYGPYRRPIGLRGEGFEYVGNALFIRDIDELRKVEDPACRKAMLDKLAFIAIIFHQFEYALECLERGGRCAGTSAGENGGSEGYAYMKMLRELESATLSFKNEYPPTFAEKYSFQESRSRFEPGSNFSLKAAGATAPRSLQDLPDSSVERILRKYDLDEQADLIKKFRIEQSAALI